MGTCEVFSSAESLGAAVNIEIVKGPNGVGFPIEADWAIMRGAGFGHSGFRDGWLVTFAAERRPDPSPWETASESDRGALIGHEVVGNRRTGRTLLLTASEHGFGPMLTAADDRRLLDLAREEPWFRAEPGGVRLDVEAELVPWL